MKHFKKVFIILLTVLLCFALFACGGNDDGSNEDQKEDDDMQNFEITITVNGSAFKATFYNNETARAIIEKFPLTIVMTDLNANEKYYNFSESFPVGATEKPAQMNAGDIMLWQGNCLVLFYNTFANSYGGYVRVGVIDELTGFTEALGSGNAEAAFEKIIK